MQIKYRDLKLICLGERARLNKTKQISRVASRLFYVTDMSDGSAMYRGDIQSPLGRWEFNASVIDKESMLIYLK